MPSSSKDRARFHPLSVVGGGLGAGWLVLSCSVALAGAEPAEVVAAPGLTVVPAAVVLDGRDSRQQLLVSETFDGGRVADVTREAHYRSADPRVAEVDSAGVVRPRSTGRTRIEIEQGVDRVELPVEVFHGEESLALDFPRDIVPILTKAGCNSGGCHGKSDGRGGFALSLFGYDPASDYDAIVNGSRGRRLFPARPEESLLLKKPVTHVPHGGGKRLAVNDPEYATLTRWIAAAMPWGHSADQQIVRIEVTPALRALRQAEAQQVAVTAFYRDGSRRDVTRTTEFRSNDPAVATVDERGLARTLERTGETAVVCLYQGQACVARIVVPLARPTSAQDWAGFPRSNFIDDHVLAKHRQLNVRPSSLEGDAGFLRRATLQIAGRVPTLAEARAFLADSDPIKRSRLIDGLASSSASADHFAQKWADILRNKRRQQKEREPGTLGFHRWIRNAIAENMPYDEFVRAIITASGSPAVHPPAQWYAEVRYLDRYVDDTAEIFLGVRIGCARCHNHPFEKFTQDDYYGLAAFFARVGRKGGQGVEERRANEVIFVQPAGDVRHPGTGRVVPPCGLDARPVQIAPYDDPRGHLVDWMTQTDNPYFARAFVNRMWAHFFGRGLVEPLDDLRVTNPASNEPLLDALADAFIKSRFDVRAVVRLIATSTTYQLSATPNGDNLEEVQAHSRFYPQRLPAEVLLDALDVVTGSPTSFSGLPPGTTATQLPDEDSGNAFLALFGRPPRESACECERISSPSLTQSLYLMNDATILGKIGAKGGLAAAGERPATDRGAGRGAVPHRARAAAHAGGDRQGTDSPRGRARSGRGVWQPGLGAPEYERISLYSLTLWDVSVPRRGPCPCRPIEPTEPVRVRSIVAPSSGSGRWRWGR